jgi:hypothetical protein
MGCGYHVSDDCVLYWDHSGMYDCFEYYNGKLNGKERILHYISLFIKSENEKNRGMGIDLPELLTMQSRIILEHYLDENLCYRNHGCYIPDNLLAENRMTNEEKKLVKQGKALAPWVAKKLTLNQVKFLAKEFGSDMESTQEGLVNDGGWYLGKCAGVVHQEKHYERTGDARFNADRGALARSVLEAYGSTEDRWIDSYADPNFKEDGLPPMPDYSKQNSNDK